MKAIPVTRTSRFILVLISLSCTALSVAPIAGDVTFQKDNGRLVITVDGHPFAVYVWNDSTTTRPYFEQIKAAGGTVQMTRNHPPAPGDFDDHATFHPGLWWGLGDVGGNDYWRLKARVIGGEFVTEPVGGKETGHFAVRNRLLVNGGDETFCDQICHYSIHKRPNGILMVCESTLRRDSGDFWLGDQEEMGLAIRVATPLTVATAAGGRILNSNGRTDLTQIRTRQSDWCDYSGPIAGKHGGMLVMNDPDNFRKPWWHAVKTGLLVANPLGESELNGHGKKRNNVLVRAGESFRLRYGVLIHLNDSSKEFHTDKAYDDFLGVLSKLKRPTSPDRPPPEAQANKKNSSHLPRVPQGFEVSIYAQEPLVFKPTSMCFDAQGRLFVGQGPQYPRNEEESPTDSVLLLIDADNDGVAERSKEFARGLNSIQGLAWRGRDLYVANAPELTLVRDLDGDDEADEYVVIYTDLGNREHALHGLNFGPDGKLYMSKGNSKGHNQPDQYGHVAPRPFRELWDVEHPPGAPNSYPPKVYTKNTYRHTYHHWDDDWGREGGILRCGPLGENLEIVSRGLRNPWDIAMDDGFNWLGTDNDQTQGDRIVMPFYAAHFGWGHRYSSHWTGEGNLPTVPVSGPLFSGSGAGIIYYGHDHFPPDYRNVFFINDWLFGTYVYRPGWDGALRQPVDGSLESFMQRSPDGMLYRPTDLAFGPDGTIYTLGWGGDYHYEPGKEGSWVFRIRYRNTSERIPSSSTADLSTIAHSQLEQLLSELGPEVIPARRVIAQNELVRRGNANYDQLVRKVAGTELSTGQQTWAVWALGRMNSEPHQAEIFQDWTIPKGAVSRNLRIQSIRILGYRARWLGERKALTSMAGNVLSDADPRIRFEAMQAIHQARLTEATKDVLERLAKETDRLVFYAGWQALRDLGSLEERKSWLDHKNARVRLATLLGLQEEFSLTQEEAMALVDRDSDPTVQSWALSYAMNPRPPSKMPNTRSRVELEQTVPVGQIIARAGAVDDRPEIRRLYLRMIARASVRGGEQQHELLKFYRTLETEEERTVVLPAIATTMDSFPDLWEALGDTKPLQEAAVQGIGNLLKLRTSGLRSSENAVEATSRSLSSMNTAAAEIANRLLTKIAEVGPDDQRASGTFRALDALPLPQAWSITDEKLHAILAVLKHRNEPSLRRHVLRLLRKLDGSETSRNQRITEVLKHLCRTPSAHLYHDLRAVVDHFGLNVQVPAPKPATAEGVLSKLAEANTVRGEEIFFEPIRGAGCVSCHRVRGRGSALAPDLSGIGTRLTPENMIKALLEPSSTITEGYSMHVFAMSDGRTHTGAVIHENDSALTLLMNDGTRITIKTSSIEERKKINQSVMPNGYELFGDEQLADLTAWLLTLRDEGNSSARSRTSP